jgi:hypothetical protein
MDKAMESSTNSSEVADAFSVNVDVGVDVSDIEISAKDVGRSSAECVSFSISI